MENHRNYRNHFKMGSNHCTPRRMTIKNRLLRRVPKRIEERVLRRGFPFYWERDLPLAQVFCLFFLFI